MANRARDWLRQAEDDLAWARDFLERAKAELGSDAG